MKLKGNEIAKVSVVSLCRLFGVSRQAFYQREEDRQKGNAQTLLVLDLILAFRRDIPGLGTRKLHLLLRDSLAESGIKLGRDKLHRLLQDNDLVLHQQRHVPKTTNSTHRFKKYPNLLINKVIDKPRQVWVSDITYLYIGFSFGYLSLITDAYSKLIVGYCLHPYLNTDGCLMALEMALMGWSKEENELIHHSDRGSQYCSFQYIRKLQGAGISISMTQQGDPYENAVAERVNGILKTEFLLNQVFSSFDEASRAVEMSIHNYNHLRPHMSCDYLTPAMAHVTNQPLKKHWKPKVYKRASDIVSAEPENSINQ
jgi:putative transposase